MLIAFSLLFVLTAQGQQGLYIDTHLPDSHLLKKKLIEKLNQSRMVTIVTLPDKADLVLDLEQTGRSLGMCAGGIFFSSACGHRGRVVLKSRLTGEELWGEEKGGAWQMSGWSDAKVGRQLGNDLIKFLSHYEPPVPTRPTNSARTNQAPPTVAAPLTMPNAGAVATQPSPQTKDSMERPTAKCRDGTYWGQTPSGDPICVWGH